MLLEFEAQFRHHDGIRICLKRHCRLPLLKIPLHLPTLPTTACTQDSPFRRLKFLICDDRAGMFVMSSVITREVNA